MRATTLQVLRLAVGILVVAALGGVEVDTSAQQTGTGRAFGPGRCGPVDPSYVRITNATGGQVLPLGPSELVAAAPLMTASSGAETVFWATAPLASRSRTISVPVDGVTTRVAFVFSTDGGISDLTITDPRGTIVTAATPGAQTSVFGCVRSLIVESPSTGEWTFRVSGSGRFWFVVHARSELALEDATFVRIGGRPGHEGLFKIHGQPVAGRPTTLRTRVTREDITDLAFDLVSMSGAPLQPVDSSPVTTDPAEDEYVGDIAGLPTVPFRVRVSGRDRTGAAYQRVSSAAFHAATVEVAAPDTAVLGRGQRTPVTVVVRNIGAPARFQIVAVTNATILRVEPATVQIGTDESRDITIWREVPLNATQAAEEIIITAESPADASASNSAIVQGVIDAIR
jgi:hypothetical protein